MLEQTCASRGQVHLKTYVPADTFSIIVILNFVQPNVARLDSKQKGFLGLLRRSFPTIFCDVDTSRMSPQCRSDLPADVNPKLPKKTTY